VKISQQLPNWHICQKLNLEPENLPEKLELPRIALDNCRLDKKRFSGEEGDRLSGLIDASL
jgi:hypothetical protein